MLRTYLVKTSDGIVIVKSDSTNLLEIKMEALYMFEYPEYVRVVSITDMDDITSTTVL